MSVQPLCMVSITPQGKVHAKPQLTVLWMKELLVDFGWLCFSQKLSFHGFPGTMAASFIHYLTSDPRTTPPEYQSWYTEKLVLLPNTYLLNDHRQSRREVRTMPDRDRCSDGVTLPT
eukprot:669334-Rhodomonas_salina.3